MKNVFFYPGLLNKLFRHSLTENELLVKLPIKIYFQSDLIDTRFYIVGFTITCGYGFHNRWSE